MEPQIRNFGGIEKFIHDSPQEADGFAREWTYLAAKHPEISTFQTPNEFAIWASDPRHKVDHRLWIGKEIRDAYFYIRDRHEEKQIQENGVVDHAGVPSELLSLPFLAAAFLQRPKTFEEDPQFQKIVEKKKKEWLAKNPEKDANSKEWIDYRYGSLENPEAATLYADAERSFRSGEDLGEKATEKEKEQRNKKVASYDKERKKVYKNLNDDSAVVMERWRIEYHAQALIAEQKKQNPKLTKEDEEKIVKQVRAYHWEKFAQKHPEKAASYAEKHDGMKEAVAKIAEEKKQTETIQNSQSTVTQPPPIPQTSQIKPPINTPFSAQPVPQQATFQQQPRPTTPPPPLSTTRTSQPPQPTVRINRVSNFPQQSFSFPQKTGSFSSMPTRFPSRSSRFPSGMGRTTNAPQPGNALSNLGSKIAQQVGSKIMLIFANPVILSVLFIFLFTFIIVFAIGPASTGETSPIETGGVASTTNGLDYTISFRDSSIMPVDLDKIKETIKKDFPLAQLQYWDKIIQQSITNKWNPAFVLALWIEETGASQYTIKENGGGGGGPPNSLGHLGCAPSENQTLDESLRCLFGPQNIFSSLTNDQFDKFMCQYGGLAPRTPPCVFDSPTFPSRIKKYYSLLVPSGLGAITIVASNATGWPTNGKIEQGPQGHTSHAAIYAEAGHPEAVDISNTSGTTIYATFPGKVKKIYSCMKYGTCALSYGNYIEIADTDNKFTVLYGHLLQVKVLEGNTVQPGDQIALMGTTGRSTGPHLHWEFRGIGLAPPTIPEIINPANCDNPPLCNPTYVSYNANTQTIDRPTTTPEEYWFILHRKSKREILYKGVPGDISKSTIATDANGKQLIFKVNPGRSDRPTPLPQLFGRQYWVLTEKHPESIPETAPYFITLDIPDGRKAPYYGPSPYKECGTDGKQQCVWGNIAGDFGLHGVGPNGGDASRLDDAGSSGCVRHSSSDIEKLYELLDLSKGGVRYYIEDN